MKIAIIVHGRFHAFDLARELICQGQDVTIFTNYPKWAAKRFQIPHDRIRSFWFHGILVRILGWMHDKISLPCPEAFLYKMFGKWAAREITKEEWDVVHSWSGISEEVLQALKGSGAVKILMRGSAHIRAQARLLIEEEARCGTKIEKPTSWIIDREEREYRLADHIGILSGFAHQSFVDENTSAEKLLLIPCGVSIDAFRPSPEIVENRFKRIVDKEPIRVLYVGSLSFRKGMLDLLTLINELPQENFKFYIVGPATREVAKGLKEFRGNAEFVGAKTQDELKRWYSRSDIFVFPTIEDGYGVVLAQAQAAGLPIITTANSCGPDIITEARTGWVLPIRKPYAFIEKLLWCDSHREELAKIVKDTYEIYKPRDWSLVARDFTAICEKLKKEYK